MSKPKKFRRPDDGEWQFELRYVYRGKWSELQEKKYIKLAAMEAEENVDFKPWIFKTNFTQHVHEVKVNQPAQMVTIVLRGDYL